MKKVKAKKPKMERRRSLRKLNIIRAKFTDITEDYLFESKPIGSGGFGSVYRAQHQETGQIRAIKHIELKENLSTVKSDRILLFLVFLIFPIPTFLCFKF
jgi:hypothetical protein